MSQEYSRSLDTLNKAVHSALNGAILKQSSNLRTYHSLYHVPGKDINAGPQNRPERAQVIMTILGDRRPYQIQVRYRIEKRKGNGSYSYERSDQRLAEYYLSRVNEYLASRPEQRDMIDDFRAY